MEGGGGEGVHGPLLPVGTVFSLAGRMCSGQGGVATVGQAGLGVLTQAVCFSSLWQKWLFFTCGLWPPSLSHTCREARTGHSGIAPTPWRPSSLGTALVLDPATPTASLKFPIPLRGGLDVIKGTECGPPSVIFHSCPDPFPALIGVSWPQLCTAGEQGNEV